MPDLPAPDPRVPDLGPDAAPAKTVLFDAVLHPNRSLSQRGFLIVMAILCVVSFAAGIVFMSMGAWPVFGFFGLDVLAVYVAFRLNYRSGRLMETVTLTEDVLLIRRIEPSGSVQEWRFQPYWAKVVLITEYEDDNRLMVTSHGQSLTIASFLSPEERCDFAGALSDALGRHRSISHGS